MEAKRKNPVRRKPLSDCTNTISTRNLTSSLIKPSKFLNKNPENNKIKTSTNTKDDTRIGSNNYVNKNKGSDGIEKNLPLNDGLNPRLLPSVSSTPHRFTNSSSTTTTGEFLTVYTRRQSAEKTKKKGKMVAVPFSCPPAEKIRSSEDKLSKVGASNSCALPQKKRRCNIPSKEAVSRNDLPEKYIEEQRNYFREIDAFELLVEEASESDLE